MSLTFNSSSTDTIISNLTSGASSPNQRLTYGS